MIMAPLVGMRELERLLVMEEWPYRLYIGDALICPERAFLIYTLFCIFMVAIPPPEPRNFSNAFKDTFSYWC